MHYILPLLALALLLIGSCGDREPEVEKSGNPTVSSTVVIPKDGESKIDALIRERQEALGLIASEKAKVANLDAQIKQVENDRIKFYSNLIGGICVALALICGVAAFFTSGYPLLPVALRYASYGLATVGALAFSYAVIFPYLVAVGMGILLIILAIGIYLWVRDRSALKCTVNAIENTKKLIPNYKTRLREHVKGRDDAWVNRVRGTN